MEAEGVELLAGLEDLAVMGFVEVLGRLRFFRKLEAKVTRLLQGKGIDLLICIDYPGFNLRATERAHALGVPVLFYIAPQVWAWKAGRTARLARAADRIAVILPFEKEIFAGAGARVEFVGHPLLDEERVVPDRASFCSTCDFDPERPILAVFPGSRSQELARHMGPFLDAARRLVDRHPGLQVGVARASGVTVELPEGFPGRLVDEGRALLHHARAGLVKSGTTTLEAVLAEVPFVVAYRTHPVTWWLAQRLVRVEHVALANLVAGRRVVTELLQGDVSGARLADAVEPLLEDGEAREAVLSGLSGVRARLGEPGAAARVAALAAEILEERGVGTSESGGGP